MGRTVLHRAVSRVRRGESGASTAVYAGVIVVAVILVGALASGMTPVGQDIAAGVDNEICKIFGGSCGGGSEQTGQSGEGDEPGEGSRPGAVDPLRPGECVVSSHQGDGSWYVKLGVVKFGNSFGFLRQKEQYYDPETGEIRTRYNVIATDGLSLGAEGGVGVKGKAGKTKVGADLTGEAGFGVNLGDTWHFDSEAEMNAFINQYTEYRLQAMDAHASTAPSVGVRYAISGDFKHAPRSADKRSTTLKLEANGNADGGLRLGNGDGNADTGEQDFDPNIGGYVEANLSGTYTQTTDQRPGHEGEYSDTMTYSGSIGAGGNAVFAGLGGSGSYEGAVTYSYKPGPDGTPVLSSVTFNQVTSGEVTWNVGNGPANSVGGGNGSAEYNGTLVNKSYVTETTIEVTDANRAVVEAWRANSTKLGPVDKPLFLLPSNVLDPSAPPANGDPMAQLLYEEASSTRTTYNVSGDDFSLGGEAALGLKLGGGFSLANEDQTVESSTFLASPSSPGAPRQRANNLVCG